MTFLPYNSRSSNEEWAREYRTEALDARGRVVAVVYSHRWPNEVHRWSLDATAGNRIEYGACQL